MNKLSSKDVKQQSLQVFDQFGESKWIPYAKKNALLPNRRDPAELKNIGIGKALLCVGMGASLEDHIETIKKYRDRVDILVCDKGFALLLDHGIKPDYVMLCDCNIIYQKWAKKLHKTCSTCGHETDYSEEVKLIATPYANPTWTHKWKGPIYFYVNRDAIGSEKHFIPIMGKVRVIPASSNVSNAMIVFMTGMDEWNSFNFAGYERIFLVGYDYSWRPGENYYCFSNPYPKRHYMAHHIMLDVNKDVVFTSGNLLFSARWLHQYCNAWKNMPVVNCSGRGILDVNNKNLEIELSKIRTDKRDLILQAFENLKLTKKAHEKAAQAFNKTREELLWQ